MGLGPRETLLKDLVRGWERRASGAGRYNLRAIKPLWALRP